MLAGVGEAGWIAYKREVPRVVAMSDLRNSEHWAWMPIAADAALLGLVGAVLGLISAVSRGRTGPRFDRLGEALGSGLLGGLAALTVIWRVEGLSRWAVWLLTLGVAAQAARWLGPRLGGARRGRRAVWVGAGVLGAGAVWCFGAWAWVSGAAARHLDGAPSAAPGSENVLLIVLDTLRADRLGLYGYGRDTTPFLDEFAKRGVVFDEARAPAPWTLPSHASMFTGRWPHELSVSPIHRLDGSFPTLAEHLTRRGYATAGMVANIFYCNSGYGLARGFAHYEDHPLNRKVNLSETIYNSQLGRRLLRLLDRNLVELKSEDGLTWRKRAADVNADALGWLDRLRGGDLGAGNADRPFFLFLNYYDTHGPYTPPADHELRFAKEVPGDLSRTTPRWVDRLKMELGDRPEELAAAIGEADAVLEDLYDECLSALDRELGRLFGELERRGELDRTWVVVTSDHGEHFGEHGGLYGHGGSLYRENVHVPLLLIPPRSARLEEGGRVPTGIRVGHPVSLRSLAATLEDLLGLPPVVLERVDEGGRGVASVAGRRFPGQSWARHWEAPESAAEEAETEPILSEVQQQPLFVHRPEIPAGRGPLQSIITRERTYIRIHDMEELYDLPGDAREERNLIGEAGEAERTGMFRELWLRIWGD